MVNLNPSLDRLGERSARRARATAAKKERKAAKRTAERAAVEAAMARREAVFVELAQLAAEYPDDVKPVRPAEREAPPRGRAPSADRTYGGESVRTVSGGLPTHGRRR